MTPILFTEMMQSPDYTADQTPQYTKEERETLASNLASRKIIPILENKRSFWLLFCNTLKTLSIHPEHSSSMHAWQCKEERVICIGIAHLNSYLQYRMNLIRNALLSGLKERHPTILCPLVQHIYGSINYLYLIPLDKDLKANFSSFDELALESNLPDYSNIFLPCLLALIESLGATLSKQHIQPNILDDPRQDQESQQLLEALYIHFPSRAVYPIPPLSIIPRTFKEQSQEFYDLFLQQIFCDATLVFFDGELKVHALILCASTNGEMLKKALTGPFQESSTKTLDLFEFSMTTGSAFIDFIYLGPDAITPETLKDKNVDVYELLKIAHFYQVLPLINCCTNVISLIASKEDAESIGVLADLYENAHLQNLTKYLLDLS